MKRTAPRVLSVLAVVCVVAALVLASAMPALATQPTINSPWAKVIPFVDGIFGPAEWNDAAMVDLQAADPLNPMQGYLYMKNDAEYLYFLIDVPGDTTNDPWEGWCFSFGKITGGSSGWAVVPGFGPSPNSATPHRIFESSLELAWASFKAGDALLSILSVTDDTTGQWDKWPVHGQDPLCFDEPYGRVLLNSGRPAPVPSVTLWGTVGLAAAMGVLVVWHLRRRRTETGL